MPDARCTPGPPDALLWLSHQHRGAGSSSSGVETRANYTVFAAGAMSEPSSPAEAVVLGSRTPPSSSSAIYGDILDMGLGESMDGINISIVRTTSLKAPVVTTPRSNSRLLCMLVETKYV